MKLYVVRDKDENLWLSVIKPTKRKYYWHHKNNYCLQIDSSLFSNVKWEDEEPTEVELVIKK